MASALMVLTGALALIVLVLLAVVVELYRDVRQLREVAGILDRPLDVAIDDVAGARPSSYGLSGALDSSASAIVLFLSDRCATCHAIAAGLGGTLPAGLWLVLEARSPEATDAFLAKYGLTAESTHGRLRVDVAGSIAERIGLRTTPVAFRVAEGRFASATTVPSSRYLASIVPNRVRLERPASSPVKERVRISSVRLRSRVDRVRHCA